MKKYIYLSLILLFITQNITAQKIYWAQKVDTCSSQYRQDKNSASEILGYPNVDPQGAPSNFAWAVAPNEINKESVETAFIELDFGGRHFANQVAVFQNYNPGVISQIYILPCNTTDIWELIYVDTAVVERTGWPDFGIKPDSALKKRIGKKQWNLKNIAKKADFVSDKYSDILNVFFKRKCISKVRIVINPLAIDGWNQIDAVAIADSKDSVKYPQPVLADQSLILQNKATHLKQLSSSSSEIMPVVYPNGKILYYTKPTFDKKNNVYTQSIWATKLKKKKIHECMPSRKHIYTETDVWDESKRVFPDFEDYIPHAIVGFSQNGEYMYLTNTFKQDSDSVSFSQRMLQSTAGLSVSHLDSSFWTNVSDSLIKDIDSNLIKKFVLFTIAPDSSLIICLKNDTANKNKIVFALLKNKKTNKWAKAKKIGNIEESPFVFGLKNKSGRKDYHIKVDTTDADTLFVASLKWSVPKPVKIENFANYSNYAEYYIYDDGKGRKVMFLAIDDSATIGKRDIFVSFYDKNKDTWSSPQNIGFPVNTLADEASPFMDNDGTTLYFSSAGHKGFGEYDIYMCRRLDNTWLNWSEPVNMGEKINTGASEINFYIDQNTRVAYYTSYFNAVGCNPKTDLYSIQLGKPVTIHFKGVTRNVNSNNSPIGGVDIKFTSLINDSIEGFKDISFKSDSRTGAFDIKITKLIEANKLHKFAYKAKKGKYKQTDKDKNPIPYVEIDLENPDWNVTIYKDLYIAGPKYNRIQPFEPQDEHKRQKDTTQQEEEKIVVNDTILEVPDFEVNTVPEQNITGKLDVDTMGCPVMYYAGTLYGISMPEDTEEPAVIEKLTAVYQKYFDYNEIDVSINEPAFKKLKKYFLDSYNEYGNLTVFVVASASPVPTSSYCSNFELARMRAEEPIKRLKQIMTQYNIPASNVYFDSRYVVVGRYENDAKNRKKYKQYQFVKVWIYSCPKLANINNN